MDAEVVAVTSGDFAYDGPMYAGLTGNMGVSDWLRNAGVNVVVVTAREQPLDPAFAGVAPVAAIDHLPWNASSVTTFPNTASAVCSDISLSLAHGIGHGIERFGNPDFCGAGPLQDLT